MPRALAHNAQQKRLASHNMLDDDQIYVHWDSAVPSTLRRWGCGSLKTQHWYVVATEYGDDSLAAAEIRSIRVGPERDQPFQVFYPKLRVRVPPLGKRPATTITRPVFPGYVFALWADGDPWHRVRACRGVSRILHAIGDPDAPARVPAAFIDAMMLRASMMGVIEDISAADMMPAISAGSAVRIMRGPFAGHLGVCEWSDAERVGLLHEVMGVAGRLRMRRDHLEAV